MPARTPARRSRVGRNPRLRHGVHDQVVPGTAEQRGNAFLLACPREHLRADHWKIDGCRGRLRRRGELLRNGDRPDVVLRRQGHAPGAERRRRGAGAAEHRLTHEGAPRLGPRLAGPPSTPLAGLHDDLHAAVSPPVVCPFAPNDRMLVARPQGVNKAAPAAAGACGAGVRQPLTAIPATSKRAPRSSGPEPRKARAGGSALKYSRYTRLNTP